jgi:hypothetical protein
VQGGCYRGCGSARTPLSRRSGLNTRPFAFLTQPWLETRVWFPSTSQPGTGFQISRPMSLGYTESSARPKFVRESSRCAAGT